MTMSTFRVSTLLIVAAIATGYGQSSPANRQWPPEVQKVPDDSPALSPEEALKTFYMPPGYHLELVASEPLIQDPIVMDWDLQGRLWAIEMPGFVPDLEAPEPFMEPVGKVVVLEDTNRDGQMDKRTVFADGLVLARSLKVLDAGVLVAEPPNVWLMKDTNGDLKMDKKELVTDTYGRREARVEQNANGFYWGLDNWMHTANSDVFLRFKDGKFEVRKTLSRGEWGVTHDDAGRIYRNTNESVLHADLVPTQYYMRNPNLLRTRGSYERLADEANTANTVWPVRPNPGTNRAYQLGIDRGDGTLARFTAVCAPIIYRGDRLPADLYGNAFAAEPAANLVGRVIIDDTGSTLRVRKAYDRGEFLASTDERFRPVWLSNAPDGTLYIVDMYRGVMSERWLTEPNHPIHAAVLKRLDDTDWSVRQQLAASLGALPQGPRENAIATLVAAHADDPVTLDAALSGVRGGEGAVLDRLIQASDQSTPRETAITMIAATIVRAGQDEGIQKILAAAADANRPLWQRSVAGAWGGVSDSGSSVNLGGGRPRL